MSIKNPILQGELFIVKSQGMYLTIYEEEVPPGAPVMFLESQSYEQALIEHGKPWETIHRNKRLGPKNLKLWKMLWKEKIFLIEARKAHTFLERPKQKAMTTQTP